MQNRIYSIAAELAKVELHFKKEDQESQDKLKKLKYETDIRSEEINTFIKNTMARMQETYKGLQKTSELEIDIITALEEKLVTKELTSIRDLNNPSFLKVLDNEVVYAQGHNSRPIQDQIKNNDIIAGVMFATFANSNMSLEDIVKYENHFKNTLEYKQAVTHDMDNLFSGKTSEETNKAAMNVSLRDITAISTDNIIRNKDKRFQIVNAIAIVTRGAIAGNDMQMKEAVITAKKFGLDSMIKSDGTIDLDVAYKMMLENVKGDAKVEERYSTKEKFLEYMAKKNQRDAESAKKRYERQKEFKNEYLNATDTEEKIDVLRKREEQKKRRKEIMKKVDEAIKSKDMDQLNEEMEKLGHVDSKWAIPVLLQRASRYSATQLEQAQIVSFIQDKLLTREDIDINKTVVKQELENISKGQFQSNTAERNVHESGDER